MLPKLTDAIFLEDYSINVNLKIGLTIDIRQNRWIYVITHKSRTLAKRN